MNKFSMLFTLLALFLLSACQSPGSGAGAGTTVPQTQAAQNVGRDQGQASAAETGAASTQSNPIIINNLAAKTVKIRIEPGKSTEVDVASAEDSTVEVGASEFGLMKWGNQNTLSSETSSGGGAAGGVGGASRAGTEGSTSPTNNRTVTTPATPVTPATPPVNGGN